MRLKAGVALSYLIDIHMRPDPLFNELANGIKNADEGAVRDTYLQVRLFNPNNNDMHNFLRKKH